MTPREQQDPLAALQQAIADATGLLEGAASRLESLLQDEFMMAETPMEANAAVDLAAGDVRAAIGRLKSVGPQKGPPRMTAGSGPTRKQGQFLAFIHEYLRHNYAGVAPTHAEFQRFFNLTPPSVNSMLIRLEKRGFIRRVPGKARAIELVIPPEQIPPLERPFKF